MLQGYLLQKLKVVRNNEKLKELALIWIRIDYIPSQMPKVNK